MAETKKVERLAAFRLDPGKAITSAVAVLAYGGSTIPTLGAGHALSYVAGSPKGLNGVLDDNSIENQAFPDLPNQVMISADLESLEGEPHYEGEDRLWYWFGGYEDGGSSPSQQFIFTVSGVTVTPTAGATYTNNSSTFTVRATNITSGAGTIRCERTTGSNDPSGDTLVKASGTGDASITFSANDITYYNKIFELDMHERHLTAYRTAEQTAGDYSADDFKNRFAVFAVKEGPNDHRYPFVLCNGFSFASSAGQALKWTAKGLPYREDRGDYSSASWTFPTGGSGTDSRIMHHQFTVSLGPVGALVDIGTLDFNIDVDIPLKKDQDTESGLYIKEPVQEGKYNVGVALTLSRHSVDTYLAYRDAFTNLAMKIVAVNGNYEFGFYFPDLIIEGSDVSEEAVATNPITFRSGPEPSGGNPFVAEVGSIDLIQAGNMFILARNTNSTNEMRRE